MAGIKLTPGSPMPFDLAVVYVRLGRLDELFAHPPTGSFARVRIDPRFDALRADQRYGKLLAEFQRPPAESKK